MVCQGLGLGLVLTLMAMARRLGGMVIVRHQIVQVVADVV